MLSNKSNIIQNNEINHFVLKKGEKLTVALYLVSSFIPPEDPIRKQLRLLSIEILSFTTRRTISGGGVNEESELGAFVEELCSLLTVATVSGYISSMNSSVLSKEYRDLLTIFVSKIEQHVGGRREQNFSPDFFSIPDSQEFGTKGLREYDKRHSKRQTFSMNEDRTHKSDMQSVKKGKYQTSVRKEIKKDRRNLLIDKIRQNGRISMKDLSDMKDCSEKTLQRELLSLVNDGVLKKEGERRWSTYMLA